MPVDGKSHLFFGSIDAKKVTPTDLARAAGNIQGEVPTTGDAVAAKVDESTRNELKREAYGKEKQATTHAIKQKEQLAVPTNDKVVKERLRELGQPISLFGEGPYERRERLRGILQGEKRHIMAGTGAAPGDEAEATELFFTEGSQELKEWRLRLVNYSIPRAKQRLAKEQRVAQLSYSFEEADKAEKYCKWVGGSIKTDVSQVGDDRPVTQGRFSPNGAEYATSSWTGSIKIWDAQTGNLLRTYRGHKERCHGIAFRAGAAASEVGLASAGSDATILLWAMEKSDAPKGVLSGHEDRVNRVVFHPQGGLLASTSHDSTWRLWDIELHAEVLLQEGHVKGTYGIGFHPDGSLVATSDLAGIVRLWDVRTGRTLVPLQGHHKAVMALDFHPGGYQLVTAGDDNSARIWDLRKRKCLTIIPAHHKLVSEAKYEPGAGKFLLTASYDLTVKLWSTDTFECFKTLTGHEARVMGADVTAATAATGYQHRIGTAAYDRTFKLWTTVGKAGRLKDPKGPQEMEL